MGNLVNNEGMLMEPHLTIPANETEISIKSDGTIKAILSEDSGTEDSFDFGFNFEEDEETGETVIGQIPLFKFENPEGLEQIGHNIYLATEASGEAIVGIAGSDGYGEINAGMLERSNTDFVNAMTKLIEAQRAYQFDLRIAKDQDEMMQKAIMMRG
jgi:flagellar basal-body rod protein FlgG